MNKISYVMKSKNYRILAHHLNGATLATFKLLIEKLNYMSSNEILNIYWLFTYSPNWALQLNKFHPTAPVKIIRKEILHFLKTTDKEFFEKINYPITSDTEKALYELTPESFYVVRYKLRLFCESTNAHAINRVIYLLCSDTPNMKYGGLRSCNFKVHECEFLMPFSKEISSLIKEIYYKDIFQDESFSKNACLESNIKEISKALLSLENAIIFLKSQGFKESFLRDLFKYEI